MAVRHRPPSALARGSPWRRRRARVLRDRGLDPLLAAKPPPIPADVSPGARRSKRFGLGPLVAKSAGVPVYADVDRWRYCPRDPEPLTRADVPAAVQAVLTTVKRLVQPGPQGLDPTGAQGHGTLVTRDNYAIHQCGALMRRRAIDVSVHLPRVTFSASLSQIDVDIARTSKGWVVFDRRH